MEPEEDYEVLVLTLIACNAEGVSRRRVGLRTGTWPPTVRLGVQEGEAAASYLPLEPGCGRSEPSQSLGGRRITACHSLANLVRQAPHKCTDYSATSTQNTGFRLRPRRMEEGSVGLRYSLKSCHISCYWKTDSVYFFNYN
jgi:hypothetical protein